MVTAANAPSFIYHLGVGVCSFLLLVLRAALLSLPVVGWLWGSPCRSLPSKGFRDITQI